LFSTRNILIKECSCKHLSSLELFVGQNSELKCCVHKDYSPEVRDSHHKIASPYLRTGEICQLGASDEPFETHDFDLARNLRSIVIVPFSTEKRLALVRHTCP
jgi:hypothetical protein